MTNQINGFIHEFVPSKNDERTTIIALHGTGGSESDMIPLAKEMAPLGVQVSIVEPGSYKSDIIKNEVQRSGTGAQFAEFVSHAKEPDEVAVAVEQALFAPSPKRRYMVVPNVSQAEVTIGTQIQQLVQLNEAQPYTYDRAALVKMLDEALKGSRPKTN